MQLLNDAIVEGLRELLSQYEALGIIKVESFMLDGIEQRSEEIYDFPTRRSK